MQTVAEIRLVNLALLSKEFGTQDKVAELGHTSPVYLSQIANHAVDSKTGKPREMGDALARKLEIGCGKPRGWMDNVRTYAELNGLSDPKAMMWQVLEGIPMDEWPTAMRLLAALKKPAKNGSDN